MYSMYCLEIFNKLIKATKGCLQILPLIVLIEFKQIYYFFHP